VSTKQPGRRRIVIGISGASGAVYGIRLLELLQGSDIETHLVVSRSAQITIAQEAARKIAEVCALADVHYGAEDIAAAISSGSFATLGMIVAPCSMRSLAEIATGATTSLLTRAADVTLKERRRLALLVRETPLHLGHLRAMVTATESGAIICPPVPAFYNKPETIDDIVNHTLGRVLDLFDIDLGIVKRWKQDSTRIPL
jgi:flavin prenyltransferase